MEVRGEFIDELSQLRVVIIQGLKRIQVLQKQRIRLGFPTSHDPNQSIVDVHLLLVGLALQREQLLQATHALLELSIFEAEISEATQKNFSLFSRETTLAQLLLVDLRDKKEISVKGGNLNRQLKAIQLKQVLLQSVKNHFPERKLFVEVV